MACFFSRFRDGDLHYQPHAGQCSDYLREHDGCFQAEILRPDFLRPVQPCVLAHALHQRLQGAMAADLPVRSIGKKTTHGLTSHKTPKQ